MSPEVSVIMSVYNGGNYLREAMDSILCQTFGDYELIIINDGSTDRTKNILESCSDSRIWIIHQDNIGLTKSLNRGLRIAKGEYIARMDADDISMPNRLKEQVRYLRNNEECIVVGCRTLLIDSDGDPILRGKEATSHDEIEQILLEGRGAIPHPSAMFRRGPALEIGGYREQYAFAQDVDLWLRLADYGRLANLEESLLKYRVHFERISWRKHELQQETVKEILIDTYNRRGMEFPEDLMLNLSRRRLDANSQAGTRLLWGNLAVEDKFYHTARKHALKVLKYDYRSYWAWRTLIYSIVGKQIGEIIRKAYKKVM